MPVNVEQARHHLREFDFTRLLVGDLGWNHHQALPLAVPIESETYTLNAVAEKCGLVVYVCNPGPDGEIPLYPTRRKIERQVTKSAFEHMVIFTDAARASLVWQWVKRQAGRPAVCRENTFHSSQTGEVLLQKLQGVAFELQEEEQLNIALVASRVQKALDVEKVTKKFYERFKKEHETFLAFIKGISDQGDREWYASLMLNRMMFVYFIQKQRFLDGDLDYLRNRLRMMQQQGGKDRFHRFYRLFLLRLFHEGLGQAEVERAPDLAALLGKVPYLNGGLFDVHELERENTQIQIADEAFENIFNFFGEFDWHLDERPRRSDKEINPDVLGYIFEKYINQKQMGAYYTKEDITGYISRNTVIPFLFEAARKKCPIAFAPDGGVWGLLCNDPDRYIYAAVRKGVDLPLPNDIAAGVNDVSKRQAWNRPAPEEFALPTETWREHVARRTRCQELRAKLSAGEITSINDLVTFNLDICTFAEDVIVNAEGPDLVKAFWHAILEVAILDPTCGSGAFLFAALNILEPLYEACLDGMQGFLDDLERSERKHHPDKLKPFREVLAQVAKHPNRRYFVLKSIVIGNLYGVDIMEEAVEICKLRLFLKLVAQVETYDQIEPLPDIDFNIRAGNTLVGFTSLDAVRNAMTMTADGQHRMLYPEEQKALAHIEEDAEVTDRAFQMFRRMQIEQGMDANQFADAKSEVRRRLDTLRNSLDRHLAAEYGVKPDNATAFGKWRSSHFPFHWFVEFYGIMHRGGFDVIIGNPPYVEMPKIKPIYSIRGFVTEVCGNLYCPMMERALSLVETRGTMGMIVPLSLACTERMSELRELLESRGRSVWLSHFSGDANPSKFFEGVKFRLEIVLIGPATGRTTYSSQYLKWFAEERGALFAKISYSSVSDDIRHLGLIPKLGRPRAASTLEKLLRKNPLAQEFATHGNTIHVHRVLTMYVKCFDFIPYFRNDKDGIKKSDDYKPYTFTSQERARCALAFLNSSTFFFYFVAFGDCFHCGREFVATFPAGLNEIPAQVQAQLAGLGVDLIADLKKHAVRRVAESQKTGRVEYDEFWPRHSKGVIDDIDRVLARHYGFTDEELDFIINYDIKYRLGQDGVEEAEE